MSSGLQKVWFTAQACGTVASQLPSHGHVLISQVKVESELREVWLDAVKCPG